jgi:hypothetical protein
MLVGYPIGMLADRIGREAVLAISYGVFLASTVLMLISTSSIHALRPCRSLWCAYIDISETVQRALVPKYMSQASSAAPPMACTIWLSGFHFLRRTLFLDSCLTRQAYSGHRDVHSIATTVIAIASLAGFQALRRKMWAS